jgi:putative aminopeptidase FrvX
MDARSLLEELTALPGPPGQEDAVRDALAAHLAALGRPYRVDAKGNLLTAPGATIPEKPRIVVAAHLDEIALLVTGIGDDGALGVAPLGGVFPWKWGEGPVEILATSETIAGIVSLGSIHTGSPHSAARQARDGRAPTWDDVRVVTGRRPLALQAAGVRPGTRVVMARDRRRLVELGGGLIAGYFLDDRADLVAWLLALAALPARDDILFAATTSEEVGGEGALWLLGQTYPDICIALEIGPLTPDAALVLDAQPTVWVRDSYAATAPSDLDAIAAAGAAIGIRPQFHIVTRGGSDASCAASHGLCARPITLAFAAENSHGFEIMHADAMESVARLTVALLERL